MLRLTPLLLLLCSEAVNADRGEVLVDAIIAPEVAWLAHPAVHEGASSPFDPTGTFTLLPRVGLGARYGLANDVHVGVGLDGAAFSNLVASGVAFENITGDLFTGGYFEAAAPFLVGWRFDSGSDLSGVLELQGGPLLTFWSASALADPTDLDAAGLPARFPVDIPDTWHLGGTVRAQALFEVRLWDVFIFAVGPSLGISWADTVGVHAGLVLRPSAALGAAL